MGCADAPTINGLQMTTLISRGIKASGGGQLPKLGSRVGNPASITKADSSKIDRNSNLEMQEKLRPYIRGSLIGGSRQMKRDK